MQGFLKGLFKTMISRSNKIIKKEKLGTNFENRKNNSLKKQSGLQIDNLERTKKCIGIIQKRVKDIQGSIVEYKKLFSISKNNQEKDKYEAEIKKLNSEKKRLLGLIEEGKGLISPKKSRMDLFNALQARVKNGRVEKETNNELKHIMNEDTCAF